MTQASQFTQHDQNIGQQDNGHTHHQEHNDLVNQEQGTSLSDTQLLEQFREIQQIELASSNKLIELQTRLSESEKRMKQLTQIAKEKYGVQSLKELKERLANNQAHNQQVIPQAYQQAVNIRENIRNIEQKIGQ
ncbi:hypothetical protein B9J93_03690 [Vibrio sp. V17_P4S1T151]|nr:hypothetical protein B9J93_03690 [Vibrio sp. V17_P4S1T151]OXX64953.1 hypothetical protein B9J89_03490 [Vibrio sp. V15_P4S5T153]